MYISPTTLAGGGLCETQACTHCAAFWSKHIGSDPGVAGESGMQVQPLVPLRSVVIAPLASTDTTDASCAIAAGAADSALAIGSFPVSAAAFFVSAEDVPPFVPALLHAPTAITDAASSSMRKYFDVIGPLLGSEGPSIYHK